MKKIIIATHKETKDKECWVNISRFCHAYDINYIDVRNIQQRNRDGNRFPIEVGNFTIDQLTEPEFDILEYVKLRNGKLVPFNSKTKKQSI